MIELGRLVTTNGVAAWYDNDIHKYRSILTCVDRHKSGDWGEVDQEDWQTNDYSVKNGLRILSSYTINDEKIWIITEADRSVTTVLFPSEY